MIPNNLPLFLSSEHNSSFATLTLIIYRTK
jgi:hypothetical protein